MPTSRRASPWLAAAFVCAIFQDIAVSQANPPQLADGMLQASPSIAALINRLESWLDRESHYARRSDPVTVRLVDAPDVLPAAYNSGVEGSKLRGYYDPSTATIWLVRPWSADQPRDVSILLHELVHHRQQALKRWQCPNAQELPAYKLQDRWLEERGLRARVSWLAVVIGSSCRSATVHAD